MSSSATSGPYESAVSTSRRVDQIDTQLDSASPHRNRAVMISRRAPHAAPGELHGPVAESMHAKGAQLQCLAVVNLRLIFPSPSAAATGLQPLLQPKSLFQGSVYLARSRVTQMVGLVAPRSDGVAWSGCRSEEGTAVRMKLRCETSMVRTAVPSLGPTVVAARGSP
jgi:hypothetical protein